MVDEGTLATTAEVLLAIGENGSATQILEANTNIWVKWAEGDMSTFLGIDLVADYANIGTNWKRYFAEVAANRAAWYAVNQNQNQWQLATSQSKLNVFLESWKLFKEKFDLKDGRSDLLATMGLE
jgi:hypothetical protein